jgi:hypothetical protein
LARISQGLAALRDFEAAFDRLGSKAEITALQYLHPLRFT